MRYFTSDQIKLLCQTVKGQASLHKEQGNKTAIREWMAIDLIVSSGLRVAEAADLRCNDLRLTNGQKEIFVRNGKGNKERDVQIPDGLRKHLNEFLRWKKKQGEPTGPEEPLFIGKQGPWTAQAIQQLLKKYLKQLGLYERGKSVHALRHSYAVEYYRKTRDLRGLQKQLGHESVLTTQIYADVTKDDIQDNLKTLWE